MYKHCPYLASQRQNSNKCETQIITKHNERKESQQEDKEKENYDFQSSAAVKNNSSKIRDIFSKTIEISSGTICSASDDIYLLSDLNEFVHSENVPLSYNSQPNSPKRNYFSKTPIDFNSAKLNQNVVKVKHKQGIFDPIRRWNSFHSRDRKNSNQISTFNFQDKFSITRDNLISILSQQPKPNDLKKIRCKSESSEIENTTKLSRKVRCQSACSYSRTIESPDVIKSLNLSEENINTECLSDPNYADNSVLLSDITDIVKKTSSEQLFQKSTTLLPGISKENIIYTDMQSQYYKEKCIENYMVAHIRTNNESRSTQIETTYTKEEICRENTFSNQISCYESNVRYETIKNAKFDSNQMEIKPCIDSKHSKVRQDRNSNDTKIISFDKVKLKTSEAERKDSGMLCNHMTGNKCGQLESGLGDYNNTSMSAQSQINAESENISQKQIADFNQKEENCSLQYELGKKMSIVDDVQSEKEIKTAKNCDFNRVTDVISFIDKNMINKSDENISLLSLVSKNSVQNTYSKNTLTQSNKLVKTECDNNSDNPPASTEVNELESNGDICNKNIDVFSLCALPSTNSTELSVQISPLCIMTPIFSSQTSTPAISINKFEKLSQKFASNNKSGTETRRDYLDSFINEKPQINRYGKNRSNDTVTIVPKRSVSVDRSMSLNRSDPCLHSPITCLEDNLAPFVLTRRSNHQQRPPAAPLPRRRFSVCFGKRTGGSARRPNECFVLEPSEMIVIDYPDGEPNRKVRPLASHLMDHTHQHRLINLTLDDPFNGSGGVPPGGRGNTMYQKCSRGSHSSDTSSAYSGSDTMASTHSEIGEPDELDLTGLVESIVDSDEDDDLAESMDSLTVRDTVRECLEKDPTERSEEDIETLLEFTQHLKAFTNMTLAVRRALCQVMVFAVVEKAGTTVMNDGEELDSWSVLVNGSVEVCITGEPPQTLSLGDSFGILPTMDKLYHRGIMRTKCDDCQFVCITQTDYYRIQHQGEENTRRHEEGGHLVLVTELRGTLESGARRGHVVIRGTSDHLMQQLIEENSIIDPTYVEDFLLTHRTFIPSPLHVANKLLEWFEEPAVRDRVTRVVLLWVNNHFTDFETDPNMIEFLETFEQNLENEKMIGQLRLLNIACAAKARIRNVVLARPSRDEVLNFQILGGFERNFGIFISKVDKKSKAEDVGLKRGDQILEVNGQSFEHVSHARALEILRGTTHLSITVKSNLLNFKEMINTPDNSPRPRNRKVSEISRLQADPRARLSSVDAAGIIIPGGPHDSPCSRPVVLHSPHKEKSTAKSFMTLGPKGRLRKALMKINVLPKNIINSSTDALQDTLNTAPPPGALYQSQSNPDLMSLCCYDEIRCNDYPEHVLKVYKPDQSCKYLLIHKETTAHEVVMLALREFGMTEESSSNYSLCEVSVSDGGAIKQRRLPDQLQNLAERIGLSSRYYLKTNGVTETLVPDELAGELIRESAVHFLQLNAVEVAIQLTLQDFSIFRQIESTEYIDDLFELKSRYGTPMLEQFAELVNREMFWVVTEVCSEPNVVRRSKIIKQFIKVARQCKECKNFNSMFAIVSGLGHGAVSRLRQSWERLPGKYQRTFHDLQQLMDPSRNMSKYRQLVSAEQTQPPIIPFYPVVKKDLTFIHLGNDSRVENLVNFEKLRMIAKEVRTLTNMCSSPYDLLTMLELGGQPPSSAMVALNQLTTAAGSSHHSGQATVKRRKKSAAAPNPKKMFEESQMVRRVKAYLNNMRVINDETKLHALSLECEGNGGGHSGGSGQPARRRHASPAPSTASSTSTTSDERKPSGTKFGAASPQAVRKLLSLSEPGKTRPHQPRQPSASVGAIGSSLGPLPPGHLPGLIPPHVPPGRRPPSASGSYSGYSHPSGAGGRAMHERSHSDTPTPLPSVALSAESSSVTSLSNLPLRKTLTSGSVASSDSGHSTGADTHSTSSAEATVPSLAAQHHTQYVPPAAVVSVGANRRQPPAYSVAAQMARLHRLGRAHSHEGCHYHTDPDTDQDDEDTQVSAV